MKQRWFSTFRVTVLLIFMLIIPTLACNGNYRLADPTRLAPNDLSGQDFSSKKIAGRDLSGKHMPHINFSGSEILNSNFSRADLQNANLTDTLIQRTNFSNADMRGVKLDRACMDEHNIWTDARLDDKWAKFIGLLERGIAPGQDLRGYDLSNVCIWGNRLDNVNLAEVNLMGAKIFGSMVSANLANSDLRQANLSGVDLRGANLTGADLTGAKLRTKT